MYGNTRSDNMKLKELGNANVYSWFAVILPFAVGSCMLIFGYAMLSTTILLFSLLAVGAACAIFRVRFLLKNPRFASKKRVIAEYIYLLACIVAACVFTNVEYADTPTGFILEQRLMTIFCILIVAAHLGALILQALTNQKMGKSYLKQKKEQTL